MLVNVKELLPQITAVFSSQRRNRCSCHDKQANKVNGVIHNKSFLKSQVDFIILHKEQYPDPLVSYSLLLLLLKLLLILLITVWGRMTPDIALFLDE